MTIITKQHIHDFKTFGVSHIENVICGDLLTSSQHYFNLQRSELAIFQAAANIYASYVATGRVPPENDSETMKKAIAASISIARYVENTVQSDDELS